MNPFKPFKTLLPPCPNKLLNPPPITLPKSFSPPGLRSPAILDISGTTLDPEFAKVLAKKLPAFCIVSEGEVGEIEGKFSILAQSTFIPPPTWYFCILCIRYCKISFYCIYNYILFSIISNSNF